MQPSANNVAFLKAAALQGKQIEAGAGRVREHKNCIPEPNGQIETEENKLGRETAAYCPDFSGTKRRWRLGSVSVSGPGSCVSVWAAVLGLSLG